MSGHDVLRAGGVQRNIPRYSEAWILKRRQKSEFEGGLLLPYAGSVPGIAWPYATSVPGIA
eukprot:3498261-Rhodomonas_salina.2